MMNKADRISVEVLQYHTFAGKEYHPGDHYDVVSDAFQTADQYLETLTVLSFAKRATDAPSAVPAPVSHPVEPLSTSTVATPAKPAPAPKKK